MKVHTIEVGDIIEHGVFSLNDTLKVPALYKIAGITRGSSGFELTMRSTTQWKEYLEWWEKLKARNENTSDNILKLLDTMAKDNPAIMLEWIDDNVKDGMNYTDDGQDIQWK